MGLKEELMDMKKELNEVKQESFAMEILKEQKLANKRLFIALMVVLVMWFATGCYLVYILNDISVIETSEQEITDVETIENSNIINGGGR